jgi:hypothetical protein
VSAHDRDDEVEVLAGGIANAGAVTRIGDRVYRPAGPHSAAAHALLRFVRAAGFDGVPEPLGIDGGRECLRFVPGEVPIPQFPPWALADDVLASMASLLRAFHDATVGFVPPAGETWDLELAHPGGGPVICHHDVCPENVVFRDGRAVALLDFDFAGPGTGLYDMACFARMCVPIDTPEDMEHIWGAQLDPFTRLRVAADAYGLSPGRGELLDIIEGQLAGAGEFVRRRVDAGDPAFTKMWHESGGAARYERRQRWFADNKAELEHRLG